ncbi:MAG: CoA-binding protein [Bryobacteraceae bacterium]|nr:CoA-binding protein [Bryobacteraceae bacterium]
MPASRVSIDNFLRLRRIAVVGVSRNAKDFSRMLWSELSKRGYDLVPVNRNAEMIEGVPAYPDIASIEPAPEGVLLMVPATESLEAVRQAVRRSVKGIWFYRGAIGQGAVSREAVELAATYGCDVVPGECPFMYLPKPGAPHSWHRGFRALIGTLAR